MEMEVDASFVSYNSVASSSTGELESDLGREALREICCSSLSRILDLSDNKLEILLGEDSDEESTENSSGGSNVAKNIAHKLKALSHRLRFDDHHNNPHPVPTSADSSYPTLHFGSSIDSNSQEVLIQLIAHVENFAQEEGLFRKPGSHSRIEQLTQDLASLPFHCIVAKDSFGPADYASVLKAYFNELPEPFMMSRHIEAYKQASVMDEEKRTLCLQLLMLLLPPTHHVVLSHLLHLLSLIVQYQATNRMNAHNLAVVFGPTLFLDMKQSDVMTDLLPKVTLLLEHMIVHNVEIFEIPNEVRLVAEKYMKRREASEDVSSVPVDIYSSACKRSDSSTFHEQGQDNAMAELASLYEYVKKMPDGPQKQHFLKKFESSSKIAGTPPPYIKTKKTKENKPGCTPKLPKAVGSHHQIATPMRPVFQSTNSHKDAVHSYATPLRPKANLLQYEKMETDV